MGVINTQFFFLAPFWKGCGVADCMVHAKPVLDLYGAYTTSLATTPLTKKKKNLAIHHRARRI
jgi:hypothetical protein